MSPSQTPSYGDDGLNADLFGRPHPHHEETSERASLCWETGSDCARDRGESRVTGEPTPRDLGRSLARGAAPCRGSGRSGCKGVAATSARDPCCRLKNRSCPSPTMGRRCAQIGARCLRC